MSTLLVVSGTGTGVGKTIVSAAIASSAASAGKRVGYVKLAQTGDESDAEVVDRLAEPSVVVVLASYPQPLAPATAARVAGMAPLDLPRCLAAIRVVAATVDLTLVEGAGGLLVPMGRDGWTVADAALALTASVVVVVQAGLGTLNHTALTLEALDRRGLAAHCVIGAWPAAPELVHRLNLEDLPPLDGIVPDGAGALAPEAFRAAAPTWLAPSLHGTRSDPRNL